MEDTLIGQQLRGYEIREKLGAGGFGAVYKAFQPTVGREVAVKVILPQYASDTDFARRFESEAQLVARLEHPYIVPLYDYWRDEAQGAFLVMRLVKGGSVRSLLDQQIRLPPKQILRIYNQVASALAIAHEAQIIHRDLKPDNILLDQYGNAYLTDFGIAKNLTLNAGLTAAENFMGTPAYISPEQIQELPITPQTDIYSLGIMLYELITGKRPFNKPGLEILISHVQDAVPSILESDSSLPEALDDVIRTASAKEPQDRYPDVLTMVEALREALSPVTTPIIPLEAQPRYINPNRHVFIAYSRQDIQFVNRLTYDLQSEGIPVWTDKQDLKPGTRNWEDALRNAIRDAYAVVLVASPDSRQSKYVQDELAIAEMYQCTVYPVWAAGDAWIDSIALGMGKTQYYDARDDQYNVVLPELIVALGGRARPDLESATEPRIRVPPDFKPRNPYKGLRAFRENDQSDFFGRTGLIDELVGMLATYMQPGRARFLSVIGPSGSGKSSVVMAGLLPALQLGALPGSADWLYLPPMVPGADPLENLALTLSERLPERSITAIREELRDPSARGLHLLARQIVGQKSSNVVLYIDQFEELFTQTTDEALRQQFINLLLIAVTEPGGPLTVVVTLRADFYDRPMNYPELGTLVESNSKSVLPLSLSDLYDVVQKPANLPDVLLEFDEGLIGDLVFEVRDQIGGLPLLQFTLDQLFERRDGRRLTMKAYQEIGGVKGALAKHAEATYERLPSQEQRNLARALFLRLIEPGSTEQDTTRRRAPINELVFEDPEQTRLMRAVADAFVQARLLLTDSIGGVTTIEVSHEALIREWHRLGEWLEEARDDISLQRSISADAQDWIDRGRRPEDDGLYRGTLLEDAQNWAARNVPSRDEMAFINASAAQQAARIARENAIARRVQNFGRAAAVLAVVGVVAVIATVIALTQSMQAQAQVVAAGQTLTPIPGTLTPVGATLAAAEGRIEEANVLANDAQTQIAESGATLTPVGLTLEAGNAQLTAAVEQIAAAEVAAEDASTQVAQVQETLSPVPLTLTPVGLTLEAGNAQLTAAVEQIAAAEVAAEDASTQVAQVQDTLAPVPLTLTPVPLTLTPIGLTLEAGNAQLTAAVEQIAAAEVAANDASTQVAQAEVTSAAGNAELDEARSQLVVVGQTLTPVPQTLTPVALTLAAGDAQLATAQREVLAVQEQVTTVGQTLTPIAATLIAAQSEAQVSRQAADSQALAVDAENAIGNGNYDLALVLALESSRLNPDLPQTQQLLNRLAFNSARMSFDSPGFTVLSPDSSMVAVDDGSDVVLYDLATRQERYRLTGHTDRVNAVDFSPDGRILASASADSTVILWDISLEGAGNQISQLTGHSGSVNALDFNADGTRLLTGGSDNTNIVWNLADGSQLATQSLGNNRSIYRVRFDPSGQFYHSWEEVNEQYAIIHWRIGQTQPIFTSSDPLYESFDVNGRYAFSSTDGAGRLVVWNSNALTEARSFSQIQGTDQMTARAFNPASGSTILVGYSGRLTLFDFANASVVREFEGEATRQVRGLAISQDGRLAASGFNQFLVVWDMTTGVEIRRLAAHNAPIESVEFSADSRYALSRSTDGNVRVWDILGNDPAQVGRITSQTLINEINQPGFSPDGATVYGGLKVDLFTWSLANGTQTGRIFMGDDIVNVVYSPTAPTALTVFANSAVLWDMSQSGTPENAQIDFLGTGSEAFSGAAAFSPDGQMVVLDSSSSLTLRTLDNARVIDFVRDNLPGGVISLAITPDNTLLIGAVGDSSPDDPAGAIVVWDLATGQEVRRFGGDVHTRRINKVVISPDGQNVLSLSSDNTLILWEIATGRQLLRMAGHTGSVNDAFFVDEGRSVISASSDGTLIQWDLAEGQNIRQFTGHTTPVTGLVLSPNGHTFVSTTGGQQMFIWDLDTVGNIVAWTYANRYVRQLTCDEGGQYGLTNCDAETNLITAPTPTAVPEGAPTVEPVFAAPNGTSTVNARSTDNQNGERVGGIEPGQTVSVIAVSDRDTGWVQVQLVDGTIGWVSLDVVNISGGDLGNLPAVTPP